MHGTELVLPCIVDLFEAIERNTDMQSSANLAEAAAQANNG